ncbi:hypothetical protein LPAF129_02130 [Ligilactobacillus pabuli]|uniref:DUF1827 family protein n=1 Tax=Ligilactobacillus pabuli TaxID=2886039 RepID=A0ABQ5JEP6_9LACO|nr:hypothetical protein LPAF129_02130 [Ligilactobacillus pabuli]
MMNLIDVTNSYAREISKELRVSPVHFIKVYTLGNSVVVHKKKQDAHEIVISNKLREITDKELNFVLDTILGTDQNQAVISKAGKVIEIESAIK